MKALKLLAYSILLLFPVIMVAQNMDHQIPVTLSIGQPAPDFNLKGTDGKMYSLRSFSKAKALVIIFSANHCPTAQAYEDRIIAITRDYKSKGVQVVVISSNFYQAISLSEMGYTDLSDGYDDMKIRYKDKNFNFPYLYDGDKQKTALAYGPIATPHAFVFNKAGILQYSGRIDKSERPGTADGEDLRNAIDAVLSGQAPNPATTKVFGCSIKWFWKKEKTEELAKKSAQLPVTINEAGLQDILQLVKNNGTKLRLINVWATWCGPCTLEFPELITIDRMYRKRDFEFISISLDKKEKKQKVLEFLTEQGASNKNFIYSADDIYQLIEAIDPKWQGALPYTILVEPGGKIVYSQQGIIDPLKMKKRIVDNPILGRFY